MKLHELSPAEGSVKKAWRVGRGTASGNGKTSGRGHKGQKARSGYSRKRGFEGGQLPLARRLPKRGFNNRFAKPLTAVNLNLFNRFADGDRIGSAELMELGLLSKSAHGLKVLSEGTLEKKVVIVADAFSQKAIEKIQTAGGKAEVR